MTYPARVYAGATEVEQLCAPGGSTIWSGGDDFRASLPGGYSYARTGTTLAWVNGILTTIAENVAPFADDPRTDINLGMLFEPAGTNLVPANRYRDLSAWTLTGSPTITTVAGIDGTSNASRITATADNTKVALAVTASNGWHTFSAWVRRQAGYRKISISMDNGATDYVISGQLADPNEWIRVHMYSEINTNPTIAFLLAKSSDAIDVDFVCVEDGAGAPTSEIVGGATRNAGTLTLPLYGALTFAAIEAISPVIGPERRCVISRILDHATNPIITFAACDSPLGGVAQLKEFTVQL